MLFCAALRSNMKSKPKKNLVFSVLNAEGLEIGEVYLHEIDATDWKAQSDDFKVAGIKAMRESAEEHFEQPVFLFPKNQQSISHRP